jgi:hypothetical protein
VDEIHDMPFQIALFSIEKVQNKPSLILFYLFLLLIKANLDEELYPPFV